MSLFKKRWFSTSISVLGLTLILGPFQNCAPADPGMQDAAVSTDAEVRVADGWNQSKVSFLESRVDVGDLDSDLELVGLCSRSDGDRLYYQVVDMDAGDKLEGGETFCDKGGFKLALNKMTELDCNREYEVMITSSEGIDDSLILKKECLL